MKKVIFLFAALSLAVCLVVSVYAQAEMLRTYPCYRLAAEPVLDGKLEGDPAWSGIPAASGFIKYGDEWDEAAAKQTFVKAGYTKDALYVSFKCVEPEADKMKAAKKEGENFWRGETVEIFLLLPEAKYYLQFATNSIGSRVNLKGPFGPKMPLADWQAAGHKGKDYWSVEVRIPFEVIGKVPASKDKWRCNFGRTTYLTGHKYTLWSYKRMLDQRKRGFGETRNFGTLIFEDKELSVKEARKIEKDLSVSQQEEE